ncbi:snRNA-activating protein complex subunit 1-like [Lineus longissimus]|uniref:snRNA-activating protein complex subunit 1-like n=1 Tax=Lineus longissimus TaxID=88925 RepID=UPI002B4F48B3
MTAEQAITKKNFYYPYVASGVRADFDKLMETFKGTNTVRYECFLQIWRTMKIPMIFYGRKRHDILNEFVYECLHIAAEYWLQTNNLQVQIGGLYLVYGLFETQPCDPKVRLMLTLRDQEKVDKFVKDVQEQAHYDVCYIYRKLLMRRAFYYSASSKPVVLSREIKNDGVRKELEEKPERSTISDLLDPANINHLEALHTQYHVMKCALAGPNSTKPDPSLRVINTDIVEVVKDKVRAFEEWKQYPREMYRERQRQLRKNWIDDNDADFIPTSVRRNRRAEIKQHAFKSGGVIRRDRRHRQPGSSPKKQGRRKKKISGDSASTEEEESSMFISTTSGAGNPTESFPSMPQFDELEASSPARGDTNNKRKRKLESPPKSPTKTPKIILGPKKGKKSCKTPNDSFIPKSTNKVTLRSSQDSVASGSKVVGETTSGRKRGRPRKYHVVENVIVEDIDDLKSEPESLPDIVYNKKGPRKASTLRPVAKPAARGRKRSASKDAGSHEGKRKKK